MNRTEILQALARGYCTEANKKKVVDPTLFEAMANQVMALRTKLEDAERKLAAAAQRMKEIE